MMRDERRHIQSNNFAAVLVHDLLFSSGGIQASDGPIKQAVNRHKTRLQAELVKLKIRKGVKSNEELAQPNDPRAANIPRYLRVNRNMWTVEDAIRSYTSQGYAVIDGPGLPEKKQFRLDEHVPDLLIFNSEYDLHHDQAYKSGKMIAQDKASCFPAFVLDPPTGDGACVIDATAAPGNKTSHISALMGNKGKVLAFERNKRRYKTLQDMLRRAGCQNVVPILSDFLEQDPNDERFKTVTHILLDPSCSGSGIVNRLDYLTQEATTEDNSDSRLDTLAAFQKKMILHASKFPSVERIVYSTCSIHTTENEGVVRDVLSSNELTSRGFKIAPRSQILPKWGRRGLPMDALDSSISEALVRCSPGEDDPGTNGFFVSCFVRETGIEHGKGIPSSRSKRKGSAETLEGHPGRKRRIR
ncbi:S-adenosyl-L-methionine-dependent methyltransferase [Rhizoctonia solani AG-3 Rhs1AP]|uniref:S-adenosyl-L-methionine-dependent methyltransferase n=2 Tax=Rhizoctonia solani AG-3 TaxID=1086053 RepID=A0A074S2P4_9AGAM|nr:S-adenosyl-L-methionine-dependent methyltransferase [Rhizoctonia solani AG-3 Rhs1AP]KEP51153.1 S-adenosyl-L-methionine-dependent methyltransferase [Rhizoctonia solani 123E]